MTNKDYHGNESFTISLTDLSLVFLNEILNSAIKFLKPQGYIDKSRSIRHLWQYLKSS